MRVVHTKMFKTLMPNLPPDCFVHWNSQSMKCMFAFEKNHRNHSELCKLKDRYGLPSTAVLDYR